MVKSELILQTTSFLFLLIFVDFSAAKFAFFLVFFFFLIEANYAPKTNHHIHDITRLLL